MAIGIRRTRVLQRAGLSQIWRPNTGFPVVNLGFSYLFVTRLDGYGGMPSHEHGRWGFAGREMNSPLDWRESASRPNQKTVRVLIADDHDIVRRGVRSVVESRPGWQVVAEAQDGREALDLAIETKPDIAIVDYSIPIMNGAQLTRHICAESPGTQVLIFTMHDSDVLIREVLTAGARGFLVKSDADRTLLAALDALARRQPYFTGQINEALLKLYLAQPGGTETSTLTPREREVVQLIAEGNSSKEASRILNISLKTVETHRAAVMHKLNLSTTAALVRYAIRNKIVEA